MRALRYGDDEHYDVISAFIKSIRGSDPDAGLYWLARMLDAGEDARFIARRLVILASEDVGLADSNGARRGRCRRPGRRVRRPARGPAQPRPRGRVPGPGPEVELRHRRRSAPRSPTCGSGRAAACRPICATRTTPARRHWATGRATGILTTIRVGGSPRTTAHPRSPATATGSPAATAATSTRADPDPTRDTLTRAPEETDERE